MPDNTQNISLDRAHGFNQYNDTAVLETDPWAPLVANVAFDRSSPPASLGFNPRPAEGKTQVCKASRVVCEILRFLVEWLAKQLVRGEGCVRTAIRRALYPLLEWLHT